MNKAGMYWHITSGQDHSCQDWVAPQEYFIRSYPNSRNVFWDRSGFYFSLACILSQLYHDGLMEATSVEQTSVFEAAEQFARIEGILPAPESSHAIRVAIDEALKCKETGEAKTIVFGLTGTGYFDMVAYEKFNDGTMSDYIPTDEDLAKGFAGLPKLD